MLHFDIGKGHGDDAGMVVICFWKDDETLELELSLQPEDAETLGLTILRMAKKVAADNKGDENGREEKD